MMNKSINKIIWAVSPSPEDQSLENNTAQVLENLTKGLNVAIQPCCYLLVGEMSLEEEKEIYESIDKRLLSSSLSGILPTHFITDELNGSLSKKVDAVINYAKENNGDMLVLQTGAKKGLERFFLGSFAETLVLNCNMPTLTINPSTPPNEQKEIIFLTDFSEKSRLGFQNVLGLAKDIDAKVRVFHWIQRLSIPFQRNNARTKRRMELYEKELEDNAKSEYLKLESSAVEQSVKTELVIKSAYGNAADGINDYIKDTNTGLIALVGTSNSIEASLLGSLTRQMVRSSNVPVWTIHL